MTTKSKQRRVIQHQLPTNKTRFTVLAKMDRDHLALQPTSKDVEGTFSKGRRTIPYYRRSQNASSIRNQMLVNSGFNLGVFS